MRSIKQLFSINKIKLLIFSVVLVWVLYPLYLPRVGRVVIVNDKIQKADAIFVPAGDSRNGDRTNKAIALYKKGIANTLILSGDDIAWRTNSATIMERQAIYNGIPKKHIIKVEHNADSTLGESRIVYKVLKKHKFNSVVLVTSNYHSRRAKRLVSKGFGKEIDLMVYPVIDNQYYPDPDNWWKSRRQAKTLVQELLKTAWSYLER